MKYKKYRGNNGSDSRILLEVRWWQWSQGECAVRQASKDQLDVRWDLLQWPIICFWNDGRPTTDSRVHKLSYLLRCLKRPAKRAVGGHAVIAENYVVVVEVIKRWFDDSEWIRHKLCKELMQLNPASGKNLRLMVEDLERILRQFTEYGWRHQPPINENDNRK